MFVEKIEHFQMTQNTCSMARKPQIWQKNGLSKITQRTINKDITNK